MAAAAPAGRPCSHALRGGAQPGGQEQSAPQQGLDAHHPAKLCCKKHGVALEFEWVKGTENKHARRVPALAVHAETL